MHPEFADRVTGTLFGLAAGDRNGGPIRMALELSSSLIQNHQFDLEAITKHYLDWWQREGFDTGPVADQVFDLVAKGISPQQAALRVHELSNGFTAGCNPAHRVSPLAMAGFLDDSELAEFAHQESKLTHWDPLAGDIAAYTVTLCRALIRGETWQNTLKLVVDDPKYVRIYPDSQQPLNRGGFAPDVLFAAMHFLNRYDNFEEALIESIAFAGGANYCPVLVGAIGGARWGKSNIPGILLHHCHSLLPQVQAVADALSKTWELSESS